MLFKAYFLFLGMVYAGVAHCPEIDTRWAHEFGI
jgi:hypothetical protein